MRKILVLTVLAFLMTGIASAQTQDVPAPGITPDSPLYMFEKMSERMALEVAQAPLIGSEELEAKVRANQAAETLAEARVMAEKNKSQHVERLMQRYSENMNKSSEIVSKSNNSELKNRLRNISNNQMQALEQVEKKVPEQAKKGVQNAIEKSQRNQKSLENLPEDIGPRKSLKDQLNSSDRPQNPGTSKNETGPLEQENNIVGGVTKLPTGQPSQHTAGPNQDTVEDSKRQDRAESSNRGEVPANQQ